MASNYLINIPKLKGRDNYNEWAFAAENFLVLEGMENYIKLEPGQELNSADDAKSKSKLIMSIDSSLYVHIKGIQSTKDLWEKLKGLFDDSGFTRRITLLRNLISIRLESCSSMTAYVTQIIETSQKLCGTGFNINDEWIGSLLLAGLPERFSPMIMAIEHSGISITADAIKTKLLDMEPGEGSDDVSNAFATQRWSQNYNGSNKINNNNSKLKPKNKVIKCYKCKKTGHYKNQCPNNNNSPEASTRKESNAFSAVFLSGEFSKNDWYIDSGANVHLTANKNWVVNAAYETKKDIIVANNNKASVLCTGDVQISTITNEGEYDIVVEGVLCVPSLTTNLLSVSQLIKKGNKVSFTEDSCHVFNKRRELVAVASLINGVYKVNMPETLFAAIAVSGNTWHRRLGHINSKFVNKMGNAVTGLELQEKADVSKASCKVCCEGKQCRLPFNHNGNRCSELLQVVHADICGPMEVISIGGSRYFLLFVDDFSRMCFVYFLKNKNEAFERFKEFKVKVENQTDKTIKILRTDNGREFCNKEFESYLRQGGIVHQRTNAYTPEQNGLCERFNRTIVEKARCLLFDAKLGKNFWAEATNTAVYLQNRAVASGLAEKTPWEMWTGVKPDISHIRIFRSTVMTHVAKEKRQKWDKKSEKCILIGYPENIKGYRIYNPKTRAITTSRDVVIMETQSENENLIEVQEKQIDKKESESDSVGDSSEDGEFDTMTEGSVSDEWNDPSEEERPKRNRQKPERYGFSSFSVESDAGGLLLQDALDGPEKEFWLKAMHEELKSFKDNGAWELVDNPKEGTVVQCKWVLKKKYVIENKVNYRARLVAKGYAQKEGIDYEETFSPVVRHTTLRLLFALAVQLGLKTTHLDVTTAFLNGYLEETIYMKIPEGFIDKETDGKVLKLNRAIYGLKQSSRAWYKRVDDCLTKIGYK